MDEKITYNLTVRLFCGEKCFGPGMAQLLRKVQELHSLRAAAMSMNMAYSKAWTITKKAQEALGFPLLHSVTGGRWRPMTTTAGSCGPMPTTCFRRSSAICRRKTEVFDSFLLCYLIKIHTKRAVS